MDFINNKKQYNGYSEDRDENLKKRNLSIIQSIRKHLEKSKGGTELYYLPIYERAVIKCALKRMEKDFFRNDPELVKDINFDIYKFIGSIQKSEKKDEYLNSLNQILIEGIYHDSKLLAERKSYNQEGEVSNVSKYIFNLNFFKGFPENLVDDVPVRIIGRLESNGSDVDIAVEHIDILEEKK